MSRNNDGLELWTIGHSTLPLAEFIRLLGGSEIETVADVRRFPGSRRHPQFGLPALPEGLAEAGMCYEHFPELGGRRKPRGDSPNSAWRNDAFRGYADFMETEEFEGGIERLLSLAAEKRSCIMCAETLWWRCHRSLISDWLKARGHTVWHIGGNGKVQEHPYTSAARLVDGQLSYSDDLPGLMVAKRKGYL